MLACSLNPLQSLKKRWPKSGRYSKGSLGHIRLTASHSRRKDVRRSCWVQDLLAMLGAAGYVLGKKYTSEWKRNKQLPENIEKHLRQANGKAVAAINQRADELSAFLVSRKKGSRAFAENTVSL